VVIKRYILAPTEITLASPILRIHVPVRCGSTISPCSGTDTRCMLVTAAPYAIEASYSALLHQRQRHHRDHLVSEPPP
jgi:hypothetical protein